MNKKKLFYIASIFILCIFIWLSGLIFMVITDQNIDYFDLLYFIRLLLKGVLNTYYRQDYFLSAGISLGIIFFIIIMVIFMIMKKSNNNDLYGKSRFATQKDIMKAGFLQEDATSILVGKYQNKLLKFNGQQFPLLAAPTRSGKGVGIVIPNLLSYSDSIVVLDIKQENFNLTSGFRERFGQEVYLFNPFAEDGRTHRWNPLSYVSDNPNIRISDLMSIASMLYPVGDDSKNAFWLNQAQNAFLAFALYLFDQHQSNIESNKDSIAPTLGELYRLSSGNGESFQDYLNELATSSFLSSQGKNAFSGLLGQAEETFSNIMATFKAPLNAWLNPIVDASTSDNDFLLTDIRRKRMTIYVAIQPNKLAEAQLILNLFFSQLINLNTKELPENDPALKYQCLLLMDEFTSLGRVDIIAKAVSYMAGYNLRLFPIIQSIAQLDAVYGKEMSRTIITNHALQIIYTPREQQDANDYSEMLGYTSIEKLTKSKGARAFSGSTSRTEEKRALMLPQELKAMSNDKEIFLYENIDQPIMCDKIKYYNDKIFKNRLLEPIDVPILSMTEFL